MKLQNVLRTAAVSLAVMLFSGVAAQAAPITMQTTSGDSTAVLDGVVGSFDLSLQSGDTTTNQLVFKIEGNPPAFGVAALVFDGATILSASELSDPDHLLNGLVLPNSNIAAGVLIDFTGADPAIFQLTLNTLPTTATVYSLNLMGTSTLFRSTTWHLNPIEKTGLRFSANGATAAVPEPGAALCFATGLAFVASRLRRQR
jgi:hypothetical protein